MFFNRNEATSILNPIGTQEGQYPSFIIVLQSSKSWMISSPPIIPYPLSPCSGLDRLKRLQCCSDGNYATQRLDRTGSGGPELHKALLQRGKARVSSSESSRLDIKNHLSFIHVFRYLVTLEHAILYCYFVPS